MECSVVVCSYVCLYMWLESFPLRGQENIRKSSVCCVPFASVMNEQIRREAEGGKVLKMVEGIEVLEEKGDDGGNIYCYILKETS